MNINFDHSPFYKNCNVESALIFEKKSSLSILKKITVIDSRNHIRENDIAYFKAIGNSVDSSDNQDIIIALRHIPNHYDIVNVYTS